MDILFSFGLYATLLSRRGIVSMFVNRIMGCCSQDGLVFFVNRKRSLCPRCPASISQTDQFEDLG